MPSSDAVKMCAKDAVRDEAQQCVAVLPGEGAVGMHQRRRCDCERERRSPRRPRRRSRAAALTFRCFASGDCERLGLVERHGLAMHQLEPERGEAFRDVRRKLGGDVDHAVRGIDADPPRMEVELAADPARQEGFRLRHISRRPRWDDRSRPCAREAGACGRSAAEARPRRRDFPRGRSPASASSPEARSPRRHASSRRPCPAASPAAHRSSLRPARARRR